MDYDTDNVMSDLFDRYINSGVYVTEPSDDSANGNFWLEEGYGNGIAPSPVFGTPAQIEFTGTDPAETSKLPVHQDAESLYNDSVHTTHRTQSGFAGADSVGQTQIPAQSNGEPLYNGFFRQTSTAGPSLPTQADLTQWNLLGSPHLLTPPTEPLYNGIQGQNSSMPPQATMSALGPVGIPKPPAPTYTGALYNAPHQYQSAALSSYQPGPPLTTPPALPRQQSWGHYMTPSPSSSGTMTPVKAQRHFLVLQPPTEEQRRAYRREREQQDAKLAAKRAERAAKKAERKKSAGVPTPPEPEPKKPKNPKRPGMVKGHRQKNYNPPTSRQEQS